MLVQLAATALKDALIAMQFHTDPSGQLDQHGRTGELLLGEFWPRPEARSTRPLRNNLAGYAGEAQAPSDSGRRIGNLRRPHRYKRTSGVSPYTSARQTPQQTALARRRVNMLWAMP